MNLLSKKLCLVLIGATIALTGCVKKPKRPDPSATVVGPQGGGTLNPGDANFTDGTAPDLAQRTGEIDKGDMIINHFKPIYFETDKSAVKESERAVLKEAKEYLDKNPQYRLLLEGHCDWRGTSEYNIGLGDRRAGACKKFLSTLGVPAAKLETLSKGDADSKENASDTDMANDRRVDIIILKK